MLRLLSGLLLFVGASLPAHAAWQSPVANLGEVGNGQYARQWSVSNPAALAQAVAVAADASGNIYSVGNLDQGGASENDIIVSKHDAQGVLLWEESYDSGSDDVAAALTLDASGNVFVAGKTLVLHAGDTVPDYDYFVIKYDPAGGSPTVFDTFDSGAGRHDEPVTPVVVSTGAVYVSGRSINPADQFNSDILTVRYAGTTGNVVWSDLYDNAGGKDESVGAVIESGTDNVYVGGVSSDDFIVLKYAVNGRVNSAGWPHRYDSGTRDIATAIAADDQHNVYITGSTWASGGGIIPNGTRNFLTLKLDSAGTEVWTSIYSVDGVPRNIAIDSTGDVYVVGRVRTGVDYDVRVVKYSGADGAQQWLSTQYDGGEGDDVAALAFGVDGNVYVAATLGALGAGDYALLRYDSAGVLIDALSYDAGKDETASDLVMGLDAEGKDYAIVIGDNRGSLALSQDYSLIKFGMMRPDLQVDAIAGPVQVVSEGVLDVTVTLSNLRDSVAGTMAVATSFDVNLYVTQVSNPQSADLFPLPPAVAVSLLASGATTDVDISVAVPTSATLAEGNYYLVAQVDAADVVTERDETNNLLVSGTTMLIIDPPELVPTAVASGLAAYPAASDVDLTYSIANIRQPVAGSFAVSFVLSTNNVVGDGDDIDLPLVSGGVVAGISGTSSVNAVAIVHIPNTVAAGNYYVGIDVDSGNAIVEQNENNNTLVSTALLTVEPIVDLVVTDVSGAPLGAVVGDTITLSNTVQANSNNAVTAFDVGVYLSADTVFDGGDILLGTRSVASLSNGASSTDAAQAVTIPGNVSPGLYYLLAYADVNNTVTEGDETNNSGASAATISIGLADGAPGALPDLLVSDLSGPASVTRGVAFTVTPTVQNVLPTATPAGTSFDVGIYISSDSVITAADYRLGGGSIVDLSGNGVDTNPVTVTIPLENEQAVNWSSLSGSASFDAATNTLTGSTNAWATSAQVIAGDGWVEWSVNAANVAYTLGFSNAATNGTSTVDYGFILRTDGRIKLYHNSIVYPSGISTAGAYAIGDVFRVERVGTNVYFRRTTAAGVSSLIYTSVNSSAGDVVPDAVFGGAATVVNALVVDVPVAPGNYYLGAIVDDGNVIVELSDDNNSAIQTDTAGALAATTVAVSADNGTVAASTQGGGASGPVDMALLLLSCLLLLVNRTLLAEYSMFPAPRHHQH